MALRKLIASQFYSLSIQLPYTMRCVLYTSRSIFKAKKIFRLLKWQIEKRQIDSLNYLFFIFASFAIHKWCCPIVLHQKETTKNRPEIDVTLVEHVKVKNENSRCLFKRWIIIERERRHNVSDIFMCVTIWILYVSMDFPHFQGFTSLLRLATRTTTTVQREKMRKKTELRKFFLMSIIIWSH